MNIWPLRTTAQRAQDDHRADLRMCGLQDEPGEELEHAELASRHYDFAICGLFDGPLLVRQQGGRRTRVFTP